MAPVVTRAVLLRAHDYGDTSRILRFYTRGHGLVSVVARGVRDRSGKGATMVASFASGELTAYLKAQRDLHTMKDFDCVRPRSGLARDVLRFAGASAAAEIVLAHTEQEPQPALFAALETALDRLESADPPDLPAAALAGLWTIVGAFGFAPQVDPCVRCGTPLTGDEVGRFDFAAGGVRCARCAVDAAGPLVGPRARGQIVHLTEGGLPEGFTHARRHLGVLSDFTSYHVVSRPLKSLAFLGGLLPPDPDASA